MKLSVKACIIYVYLFNAATFLTGVHGLSPSDLPNKQDAAQLSSRRSLLTDVARISSGCCLLLPISGQPAQAAARAKGAFELDR